MRTLTTAAVMVLMLAAAAMAQGVGDCGDFTSSTQYSVGSTPRDIEVGDLDGDGYADFVTADFDDDQVTIRYGDSAGNFSVQQILPVGDGTYDLDVADVNLDSALDIVTVNYFGDLITVLLNTGPRTFSADYFSSDERPIELAIGQLNGVVDLYPDVVTSNYHHNSISIMLNDGNGNFDSTVLKPLGVDAPKGVEIADFDDDSLSDIVVIGYTSFDVVVLFGDGHGGFAQSDTNYTEVCDAPQSVAVADIDLDGDTDIIVGQEHGCDFTLLINDGSGHFPQSEHYPSGETNGRHQNIVVADVNYDGYPDILGPKYHEYSGTNSLYCLFSDGSGSYLDAVETFPSVGSAWGIAAGDINSDGSNDVAVCGGDAAGTVAIHYNPCSIAPVSDFTTTDTLGCEPHTSCFTNLSTGTDSVLWDFGDGGTSTEWEPCYEYTDCGIYDVTLVVWGPGGSDTLTKDDYIEVQCLPTAAFSFDPATICFGESVTFADGSGNAETWEWDFGDGETSTEQNPVHQYDNPGIYTVTLIVPNQCGADTAVCSDCIVVQDGPTAAFSYTPTEIYVDSTVQFTDESTGDPMPDSWLWDFGDGDSSTEQSPVHVYTEAGEFVVTLIAENTCGPDTVVDTLEVLENEPVDSLIIPALELVSDPAINPWCEDISPRDSTYSSIGQTIQLKLTQPVAGATIPLSTQEGIQIDSISTAGLLTEDWIVQDTLLDSSRVVAIGLWNTLGEVIEPGISDILTVFFTPNPGVQHIHWDTALSSDPNKRLLASLPGGVDTVALGFDRGRDSTTVTFGEFESYVPGDLDCNGTSSDIADLVYLVAYMFSGGPAPCFFELEDINGNCDGVANIADLVYLVEHMFQGGPPPNCACSADPLFAPKAIASGATRIGCLASPNSTQIRMSSPSPLLGIQLELIGRGNGEPVSGLKNDNIEVVHGHEGDRIKVGVLDMQGAYPIEAGEHVLLEIPGQWEIVSALAADQNFQTIQPSLGRIEPELPKEFTLGQNYPNPFNPTTEINFALPVACDVSLEIYNIAGQRVTTLVDSYLEAGQHSVLWDASSNASGVYFYRLTAGEFTQTKKMMLLK